MLSEKLKTFSCFKSWDSELLLVGMVLFLRKRKIFLKFYSRYLWAFPTFLRFTSLRLKETLQMCWWKAGVRGRKCGPWGQGHGMGDFASIGLSSADHLGSSSSLRIEVAFPKMVVWSETWASLPQWNCWLDVKLFTQWVVKCSIMMDQQCSMPNWSVSVGGSYWRIFNQVGDD